jgi:2-succinyl-5-enolpyruvyl-6-hydroxy-3-cyclohexene-1-carboxylate synthase
LRGADANQAIDQVRLFGTSVRAYHEVGPPVLADPELRHLRTLACRAIAEARGPSAGPVPLNFPFDKPLEPTEVPQDFLRAHPLAARGRRGSTPFVQMGAARATLTDDEIAQLAEQLAEPEGVIVAGPCPDGARVGAAARALASRTGFPLLADALSGARFGPAGDAHVVAAYDLILREPKAIERLAPSVILRVGASPTSASLLRWLAHHNGVPHLVIDDGPRWKDHGWTVTQYIHADPATTLNQLASRVHRSVSADWGGTWRRVEAAALQALTSNQGALHEGDVWPAVLAAVPSDGTVFVSSSMPVRDLDAYGHPRRDPLVVHGNRGASGIDGVVSTAFGVASQRPGPTVCVIGDIAFFHDQNGLLWHRERDATVVFVLIDNDGGGIFHMLPVSAHEPHFTPYVATPHGLDLRHSAALHGLEMRDVSIPHLREAVGGAIAGGRTVVLRVRTNRVDNHERHREVAESVQRSVQEALG